jgi:hypothetical protein
MEPGPELDALVMKQLFGATRSLVGGREVWMDKDHNVIANGNCSPSTDRNGAGMVVDKLAEKDIYLCLKHKGYWEYDGQGAVQAGTYEAEFRWLEAKDDVVYALGESPISDTHAICLGALKVEGSGGG